MKQIKCSFGIDIDSVAGWIGSYGGQDSPSDIQRGVFATEVGVPRLLRLFEKYDMKSTFFIPGHTMDSFPKEMEMIKQAMKRSNGKRKIAAKELGISERTLYRKIKQFDLQDDENE